MILGVIRGVIEALFSCCGENKFEVCNGGANRLVVMGVDLLRVGIGVCVAEGVEFKELLSTCGVVEGVDEREDLSRVVGDNGRFFSFVGSIF